MSLDPRIPLMGQPAQIESPLVMLSQIAQFQQLRGEAEERQARAQAAAAAQQEAAAKRARQAQIDAAIDAAYSGPPDPETGRPTLDRSQLRAHLPGHLQYEVDQQLQEDEKTGLEFQTAKLARATTRLELDTKRRAFLGSQLRTVRAANYDPQLWAIEIRAAQRAGALDDEHADRLIDITDPAQIQALTDRYIAQAGDEAAKPAAIGSFEDYVTRYATSLGKPPVALTPADIATAKAQFEAAGRVPAQPPAVGSFEDYVRRDAAAKGKDPATYTTAEIDVLRERYRLDQRPSVVVTSGAGADSENVEAIADAIIAGDQPPTLTGLYRYGAQVRAALAKKGFNLANAQTDWAATQRHFATLNNPQQTRLRQAVDTAIHSLDVIDTLAAQWKGGRFPILNRATLALAKGGTYGPAAASVAQQLDAQIADLTSELANAYMGGNSPTDHALQLAAKNLSAEWSEKTLTDMVQLARTNLQIRQNAIRNVGVIGASPQNPYTAPPTPPPTAPKTNPFR